MSTSASEGLAQQLERLLAPITDLPVRIEFWDGSAAGPSGTPVVRITSPRALRRLLWNPGELGAAQAYVTGEAEIDGDLDEALSLILHPVRTTGPAARRQLVSTLAQAVPVLARAGAVGPPLRAPQSQAVVKGRLHSKQRDRDSIHHHYDLSNEFYSLILDPSMAYSCGYFTNDDATLEQAQAAKLSMICSKLDLKEGSRLLDVGCGWGSLSIHAAKHFGARVTSVTIAAEQRDFVAERIRREGLEHAVDVHLLDYRDTEQLSDAGRFDAAASIEMGEHVGRDNYPTFAQVMHDRVRPGGRVLIQQMSRGVGAARNTHPGGGPFIENFIAPDMHMRPVGETIALLEKAGLEVRDVHAMREHYVRTVAGWIENFNKHIDQLQTLVGEEVIRVWRLYLLGGSAAFRDGRMGVDQILAVRPTDSEGIMAVHGLEGARPAW